MNKLPTVPEMSDALARHKGRDGYTQKIYKAQADQHKGNQLSEDINTHIEKLNLLACSEAQIYPSVMGLATFGFGISRQALNRWLSRNIESEAAQFILEVKDVMADVLTNAALYRNADAAMAIFQLKNHFEHADAVQIEIPQEAGPLGQKMDQRELERRISESVVLDE